MYLAKRPTMPRSSWQFWGPILWTLPKWELRCNTFVSTLPSTGPDEQRVSWGRVELTGLWLLQDSTGSEPLGLMSSLFPRAPETAADLPLH